MSRFRVLAGVLFGATTLIAVVVVAHFLPIGLPDAAQYFRPPGERVLLEDEEGQWAYLRNEYDLLEYTGDTFENWDPREQDMWKYGIAFAAYGMPSLAAIDPANADMVTYQTWVMIKKMKSKKVWQDWQAFGFGEDPISNQNIMYKGHLNLMYGLYQLMSGDERFAREFTWLTQQIVDEMGRHHEEGQYEGTNCEPDQYFVQCNSNGLLSLHIYDRLYGTEYTKNEVRWTLDFIHRRLVDPVTGLYWMEYHPSHDNTERYLSGYTNAWSLVFLRPVDPEYNEKLYPVWKETFVNEVGPYAWVAEVPGGGPEGTATVFGLWAAKEFGDVELFAKLRNSIDKGNLTLDPENNEMKYDSADDTLINGTVLAAKLHVGWERLLEKDWGYAKIFEPPSIEGMTWKDLLPQEIHEMPLLGRPQPVVWTATSAMGPSFDVPLYGTSGVGASGVGSTAE